MRTPGEVVNDVFAVLNCEDWGGLAELCDPVSLRVFKNEMLEQFLEPGEVINLTVDDLIESDPGMPRDVAEFELARMEQYSDPAYRLESELLSVATVEQLRELDPARVFARWLQARSPHRHLQDNVEVVTDWQAAGEESRKATRAYRYVVIGFTFDSPEIAYVVYRQAQLPADVYPEAMEAWEQKRPPDEAELARLTHYLYEPHVAACRKQSDGSWKLIAGRNLLLTATLQFIQVGRTPDN